MSWERFPNEEETAPKKLQNHLEHACKDLRLPMESGRVSENFVLERIMIVGYYQMGIRKEFMTVSGLWNEMLTGQCFRFLP